MHKKLGDQQKTRQTKSWTFRPAAAAGRKKIIKFNEHGKKKIDRYLRHRRTGVLQAVLVKIVTETLF